MERHFAAKVFLVLLFLYVVVLSDSCRNTNPNCSKWTRFCHSTDPKHGGYVNFMRKNCRPECCLCDADANCPFYKSLNLCSNFGSICRKSCNSCLQKRTVVPRLLTGWTNWGEWSKCTKTCGKGTRMRQRTCKGSRENCRGSSSGRQFCNADECPIFPKDCGKSDPKAENETRIVGGVNAFRAEYPWQVGIFFFPTSVYPYCGGTLITKNIVLTAAHCFTRGPAHAARSIVRVGDWDLEQNGDEEQLIEVERVIMHADYKPRPDYWNDVAIMILKKDAILGEEVRVACMPEGNDVFSGGCMASGWGYLFDRSKEKEMARVNPDENIQPFILQKVELPLIDDKVCKSSYGSKFRKGMMCAGHEKGKDTCQGDSGGPLVCKINEKFYIYGITSFGYACAEGYGVYTDVRQFLTWIHKNIPKTP